MGTGEGSGAKLYEAQAIGAPPGSPQVCLKTIDQSLDDTLEQGSLDLTSITRNPVTRLQKEIYWAIRLVGVPGIPRICDWGNSLNDDPQTNQKRGYAAFEYKVGTNLTTLQRQDSYHELPPQLVFSIAEQVADILDGMHARNVLHGDIKPSNLLWDDTSQSVSLVDLELARELHNRNKKLKDPDPNSNIACGTPSLMAPEQAKPDEKNIGVQTDFFNLGATLYTLLSGCFPYEGRTILERVLKAENSNRYPFQGVIRYNYPLEIINFIEKLMNSNPKKRHASAAEVKSDIQNIRQQLP